MNVIFAEFIQLNVFLPFLFPHSKLLRSSKISGGSFQQEKGESNHMNRSIF